MDSPKHNSPAKQQRINERIGKKLAYLLRYGAEKEGLTIDPDGFVNLDELLTLFNGNTKEELLEEIENSLSSVRNVKRFESKEIDGHIIVKATYGHRLIRNPCHDGSLVKRLFTLSLDTLCTCIDDYDFQDFPDSYLLGMIIRRLKEKSLLTNKALRVLLVPALTHLDLYNTYVNESTLKLIPKRCTNLVWITFRSCGYVVTDHILATVLNNVSKKLESLNLHGCHYVMENSFPTIIKNCPNLKHLNLTQMKSPTPKALFNLISQLLHLEELHIYDLKGFSVEDYEEVFKITEGRNFRLETADLCSQAGKNSQIYNSVWQRPNFR